jgi:hypothetical protein
MHQGSRILWWSTSHAFYFDDLKCVEMSVFQFNLQSKKQKSHSGLSQASRVTVILSLAKNSLVKKEVRDGELLWCNSQLSLHAVAVKSSSSMLNWVFGLPGGIPSQQTP